MNAGQQQTQPQIDRWRGALGKHGATKEAFAPEMLSADVGKLQVLLRGLVKRGNSENSIAKEISDKVLSLIANYSNDHHKQLARDGRLKDAVHRSKVVGWLKSSTLLERLDYRVVAAIHMLYGEDVSKDEVFSPMLLSRKLDYRADFKSELRSNDPTGLQMYDLIPNPLSILKSTVWISYHDGLTGKTRSPTFQLATSDARVSVKVVKGKPTDPAKMETGWFEVREANLKFEDVLVAVAGPVQDCDLFSLALAPMGGATELHRSFLGLQIRPLPPWFSVNIDEDIVIEWTLLAPQMSVRLSQTDPEEGEAERLKTFVRSALVREFLANQSSFPEHIPLATSRTELQGPSQELPPELRDEQTGYCTPIKDVLQ